jgi:two-component system, NtrC family, response regulator
MQTSGNGAVMEPIAESTSRGRLLIVDDDPQALNQLKWSLVERFVVMTASRPDEALEIARRTHPEIVTLDLAIEDNDPESGFRLFERLTEIDPAVKVVFITGNDARENALKAIKHGAFDFLPKPANPEQLAFLLDRALTIRRLELDNARLTRHLNEDDGLGRIIGQSAGMRSVFQLIQRVAPTDATVLVTGESGTGKELVAREIHRLSLRAERPCVCISCGAIPENLLESELFGHEKGSFTGAHASRPGKLEIADGGTVLLDEIGEMPMPLQVKILRFLQEMEIERVGGRRVIPLNVRVIAATNKNLNDLIAAERFREDLYYRLSVVNIQLPPLSARISDVIVLAMSFLERFRADFNRPEVSFSQEALYALQNHSWPGNVRELEHRVKRAVILSNGRYIRARDLELQSGATELPSLREARKVSDRQILVEALRKSHGNVSSAARLLEISRPTFHELVRKLNIRTEEFRSGGSRQTSNDHED